jgi:hypothetical protein
MPLVFQIQVNDDAPIRAGDDAMRVLTAIVSYVASGPEIELCVGGLVGRESSGNEHADWLQRELRVGDRLLLTVTHSDVVDPPARRTREDPQTADEMQRKYYERLKARFDPDR